MNLYVVAAAGTAAAAVSLGASSLSYALRDYSRARLSDRLDQFGHARWLRPTLDHTQDLIFVTAVVRLFANIMVLICTLRLFHQTRYSLGTQYFLSVVVSGVVNLFASVAVPHAAARYAGETLIAAAVRPLHALRLALSPVTKISHATDAVFRRASGTVPGTQDPQAIEDDIRSLVEVGHSQGVVDERERAMIESVISFRDTSAGQIMTARPEIVAVEIPATLADVRQVVEESGHSRIPVYERTLDHVVGILYARDLLRYVGTQTPPPFDLRSAVRPATYVPETKPLRDLLQDFRSLKVHIAIVLDEYGGTAGLVTIEDILEELVGDIADEHEPPEPTALRRVDERTWDADARVYIDQLNETAGLSLPDDAGYDTLGGFVTTQLGRIPPTGTTFEHAGATYTVTAAEPQKVTRVRIELAAATEG